MLNLARIFAVCLSLLIIGFGQITPAHACTGADGDTDCPDYSFTRLLFPTDGMDRSIQTYAGTEADTDCPDHLPRTTSFGVIFVNPMDVANKPALMCPAR